MNLVTATDEDLLAAYLEGRDGEGAFASLVDRYERRVYAICHRYFGDATDAEDATQETFINIARRAGSFQGGSKLSTWIYRVSVNTCHDMARRRARRPQTPVADVVAVADAAASHDSIGWDPGDPAEYSEVAGRVGAALAQLDEVSRALIVLVSIEGRSYEEASAILDVPIGTAKSRVHRARARLADLLVERNPDRPHDVRPSDG